MSKHLRIWLFVLLSSLLASSSLLAGVITMSTSAYEEYVPTIRLKIDGHNIRIEGARLYDIKPDNKHVYRVTSRWITISGDVTELDISSCKLTSLELSGCTTLTTLDCSYNQLTSLDVSGCTALTTLNCKGYYLTSVKLSGCTALTTLNCSWNPLTSVDVSGYTALTTLDCEGTQLTSLDLSKNVALTTLNCANNHLSNLDLSENRALKTLNCWGNQLTSLDLSKNVALTTLDCSKNQLTSLDLSKNVALTTLDCSKNQLTSLNLSKNVALTTLNCANNQLSNLDLSENRALKTLDCVNNQLTSLNLSNHSALESLSCERNQLTSLDVSGCTVLTKLNCDGNPLTSINLSECQLLEKFSWTYGKLTSLNVSGCTTLTTLNCWGNQLTSLDVSGCTALTTLNCSWNRLTSLDVSGCTALTKLSCCGNQLNGENMTKLVNSLPNRKEMLAGSLVIVSRREEEKNLCRPSDIAIAQEKNWISTWENGDLCKGIGEGIIIMTTSKAVEEKVKLGIEANGDVLIEGVYEDPKLDGSSNYYRLTSQTITIRGEVTKLDCSWNQLTSLDVSGCTTLTTLNCKGNDLTSVKLSSCTSLTKLDCSWNQLTSLDVSSCTTLTTLSCSNNKLTSLDVSGCTALTWLAVVEYGYGSQTTLSSLKASGCTALTELNCQNIQLTSLDVSGCTALTKLYCSKNKLTSLDVSSCIALTTLDCSSNQLTSLDVSKNTTLAKLECYNNRINGEEMTNLVNSLPNRKGMSSGDFFVVCNDKGEGNWGSLSDVLIAREKNWNTKWQNGDPYKGVGSGIITMTTAKAIGETIKLGIKASDPIFIDGVRGTLSQDGTMQSYTLTSNTLTIRGNVIELSCAGSQLTSLDVSSCTSLISLNCQNNELTSLDVSSCISLTSLNCQDNKLASLDVSKNSALTTLDCNRNQLSSLKVSGCTVLTKLNCAANKLESLPLLACISLTELNCEENQLTGLNLFDCKELKSLYCIKNKLNGKSMSSLIESLPDRTGRSEGRIKMYSEYVVSDETFAYQYDVRAAQKKNWKLFYNDSTPYKGAPNPICSVTKSVEGKGSLSITGAIDLGVVAYGTKLTVVATPKANYELVSLTANGVDILATKEFVVKEDVTVEAVFSGHTFNVTLEKEGAGELIAVGLDDTHEAAYGTELTIVATPAADYELTALTANGRDILATKKVVVTENMTIKATFAKKSFAVSLTKEGEGTISATGASNLNSVAYGTELTIVATPAKGYELVSITAGGTDITASKKVVVTDNLTVKATFAKKNFAVSLTKEGEGMISATGASNLNSVAYDTELTIVATPADGYELTALTANGSDILATKKVVVEGNLTVKATFTKKSFAVSLTKEGEGTISATGASNLNSVAYGTELTINATPAEGYELTALTANGSDILATKKVVVEGNLTVKATFTKKTFAVTLTSNEHGEITIVEPVNLDAVPYGTTLTVKATGKNAQCVLTELTANGEDILATQSFVVTDVTEVKATFVDHTGVETTVTQQVKLYPNPATDYVIVEGVAPASEVTLHSMTGERLYAGRADSRGTLQIDLTPYADGVYLVCVAGDTYRVVVRH